MGAGSVGSSLRFATDEDVLQQDPRVEQFFPRKDPASGNTIRDWDLQHQLGMNDIARRLRAKRATSQGVFEIGRIGHRSRQTLKDVAACFTLHYIYRACDTPGGEDSLFADAAERWLTRARDMLDMESVALDYDESGDDSISNSEEQRPFPKVIRRG